jgi:hypothetical protein
VKAMIGKNTVERKTAIRTEHDKPLFHDAPYCILTLLYQDFCYKEGVRAETVLL